MAEWRAKMLRDLQRTEAYLLTIAVVRNASCRSARFASGSATLGAADSPKWRCICGHLISQSIRRDGHGGALIDQCLSDRYASRAGAAVGITQVCTPLPEGLTAGSGGVVTTAKIGGTIVSPGTRNRCSSSAIRRVDPFACRSPKTAVSFLERMCATKPIKIASTGSEGRGASAGGQGHNGYGLSSASRGARTRQT